MKSNRWLRFGCALGGVLVLALVAGALTGGGLWIVGRNPAARQALIQLISTSTPTSTPTPTDTPTPTASPTPTQTPTPTSTPTGTPTVTPVVLDAPPTRTPASTPLPTPTETPFPTETATTAPKPAPTNTPKPAPTNTPKPAVATTKPGSTPGATAAASAGASGPAVAPTTAISPTATLTPTVPAEPFMKVGTRAVLSPQGSGVTGSAVLFSPREFTMIDFNYDGKCPIADIRLANQGFPKPPVSVLLYLEARAYNKESLTVPIPADVAPNSASALFVYCDTQDKMLAWGPLVAPQ